MKRGAIQPMAWLITLIATAGCGSSGGGASSNLNSGGTPQTVNNVQAIVVNTGPAAGPPNNSQAVNMAFTSVTVCVPGSTANCQTINDVLVDTGSPGLRILSSALTIALPQQTGSGGNPVVECLPFIDGFTWGPVQTADVNMAGEHAAHLPIQVVGSPAFAKVPGSCSSNGVEKDDLVSLGANGILGVGNFVEDCGSACTLTGSNNPGLYYTCSSSGCQVTTQAVSEQVANPVAFFASDNNGVVIALPAVTGAETSVTGSLIFGIGTQSNNSLGSATVYTLDANSGNFSTIYNGKTFQDAAFLDSGSNAIYFLDAGTTGFATCKDLTFWYCPASTQNLSATNRGANGASASLQFTVANADNLLTNGTSGAANGLAGPQAGMFDWGLPFFYGRKVYTAIDNRNTPGGLGPYWAY